MTQVNMLLFRKTGRKHHLFLLHLLKLTRSVLNLLEYFSDERNLLY